jgi:Tfp pilus assembly protein PilO
MPDPHWTSYVGMATGVFGAIMGSLSYRKSNQIKSLDLRIELKRALTETNSGFKELDKIMNKANDLKQEFAILQNALSSGMMNKWKKELQTNKERVAQLSRRLPKEGTSFDGLNQKSLEDKIIEVHEIQTGVRSISKEYKEVIDKYEK